MYNKGCCKIKFYIDNGHESKKILERNLELFENTKNIFLHVDFTYIMKYYEMPLLVYNLEVDVLNDLYDVKNNFDCQFRPIGSLILNLDEEEYN